MSIWMLLEILFSCKLIINIIDILYNLIMLFPSQPLHIKLSLLIRKFAVVQAVSLRYSQYHESCYFEGYARG